MQNLKTNQYSIQRLFLNIGMLLLIANTSCKKLVDVQPPSSNINSGNVYATDATAIAAVTDMYVKISGSELTGVEIPSLNLFPSLSSDEFSLFPAATIGATNFYYKNSLTATNVGTNFWYSLYNMIYVTNVAIEELLKSTTLTPAVKAQLTGESKFMRAFCYFYLVNLYGDVPLTLSTDYQTNALLSRKPKQDAYQQIINDLKDAQNLLATYYLNATLLSPTTERVRPTKWAATALLARVYLYSGDSVNAEVQAGLVINNSSIFNLAALNDVFLKNSNEAIWQLQPVAAGWNTNDAKIFILPSNGPDKNSYPLYLSQQLLGSFETGDQRKSNWVKSVTVGANTYFYPYKYKSATYNNPVTEYEMIFRLGEQYLIRAEAKAKQNKIAEGQSDLNVIRNRAGLSNTTANDQASLLTAILHEKQVELFAEWGHRWFDLKRTDAVDGVMNIVTPQKGGAWSTNWQLYPIPEYELLRNHNLNQNAGY